MKTKKNSLRICILTHTFPLNNNDSSAPFMGNIATSLGEMGHKVTVLTPFDPQLKTKARGPYKIKNYKYAPLDSMHTLGYSRTFTDNRQVKLSTYLLAPFMYVAAYFALVKLIKEEKIDIVNSHWIIPNGFIAYLAKLTTGVPYTTTIPGSDVHMGAKNEVFRQMVGAASRNAGYVLSDSRHYLDQLHELGFYPEKTDLIRYGVNAQNFKPTAKDKTILKKLQLNEKDPIVVCVGRLVEKKGFIYLVKAMPDVLKKIPSAKLVIVGDGYERARLEAEVSKLKLTDSVIFAGTISYDELSKYYNIADVFVMPSVKDEQGNLDASPVTMMEAMACGVPVVATKFAGSADLIINGETGFLVAEKQSKQIGQSIVSLLSKGKKSTTKKQVRKIAVDNFSIKSVAKRYTNLFYKIFSYER